MVNPEVLRQPAELSMQKTRKSQLASELVWYANSPVPLIPLTMISSLELWPSLMSPVSAE